MRKGTKVKVKYQEEQQEGKDLGKDTVDKRDSCEPPGRSRRDNGEKGEGQKKMEKGQIGCVGKKTGRGNRGG